MRRFFVYWADTKINVFHLLSCSLWKRNGKPKGWLPQGKLSAMP